MSEFYDDENDFEWGELTPQLLLRKMYNKMHLEDMSEEQVNQMLDDLM